MGPDSQYEQRRGCYCHHPYNVSLLARLLHGCGRPTFNSSLRLVWHSDLNLVLPLPVGERLNHWAMLSQPPLLKLFHYV